MNAGRLLPASRWRNRLQHVGQRRCCVAHTAIRLIADAGLDPVDFLIFLENAMSLGTILLIVLLLMLVGAIPTWGHSKSWGYGPSGGVGLIVIVVVVLVLTGRL